MYELIQLIAQVFTAIGTVGAVIVSLWLAGKQNRITVIANIAINTIYKPSETGVYVEFLDDNLENEFICITVTNRGSKPFIINNFIIYDKCKKMFLQSTPDYSNQYCTKSGHVFSESETETFIFPKKTYLDNLNNLLKINNNKNIISRIKKLKFFINTNLDLKSIKSD